MTPLRQSIPFNGLVATVQGPNGGFVYTLSLSVVGPPVGTSYTVSLNGSAVGGNNVPGSYGPIQLFAGDILNVTIPSAIPGSSVSVVGQIDQLGKQPSGISPLPASPSIEIVGGTVSVEGNVEITGGQNGVNVSTDSPPKLLATMTLAAGATKVSANVTPDGGATGLLLVLAPVGYPGYLIVDGAVTQNDYAPGSGAIGTNAGGPVAIPIAGAADAPYAISLAYPDRPSTAPSQLACLVYELLGTGVQQVVNPFLQPMQIEPGEGSANIGQYNTVLPAMAPPPTYNLAIVPAILDGGDSTELIAAPSSGQSIRLRRMQLTFSTANGMSLVSGSASGTLIWSWFPPGSTGFALPDLEWDSFALDEAEGLYLVNTGSGANAFSGRILYDVY